MYCTFHDDCEVTKVFCGEIRESSWDGYDLVVHGLGNDGINYNNVGKLHLTYEDVDELKEKQLIDDPKQLVGKMMMIASNQLCRRAGMQHLNTAMTAEEWEAVEHTVSEMKAAKADEERRKQSENTLPDEDGEDY